MRRAALIPVASALALACAPGPCRAADPRPPSAANSCDPTVAAAVASGGSGILFSTTAWAAGGACVDLPLRALAAAATDIGALTWNGVTRIAEQRRLPQQAVGEITRIAITYEAAHRHGWCHVAQWPMQWTVAMTQGPIDAPRAVVVQGWRVAGGNADGAYVRKLSLRAELTTIGADRTSVFVAYEVDAPFQSSADAADAVRGFIARITLVARGGTAPGAVADPACPDRSAEPLG